MDCLLSAVHCPLYSKVVTVKYTSLLRRDLGREEDKVEAVTVADLLVKLECRHGEAFKNYLSYCHIFVNGLSAAIANPAEGGATELSDGDEVLFLLLVTGG